MRVRPLDAVESAIAQQRRRRRRRTSGNRWPRARATGAAHFEHVGEVRIEAERDRHLNRVQRVVRHADALDALSVPEHARAKQVERAASERDPAVIDDVRVGQVGGEYGVVVDRRWS